MKSLAQNGSNDETIGLDPYHPPLYWSVYEHHYEKERQGVQDNYISEGELWSNILWVEENLLPYGYDMIAMDGWGDLDNLNEHGYRLSHSRHWNNDYDWWANRLSEMDMRLGMYDNPLWVHMNAVEAGATVTGTGIPLVDIIDPDEESLWFTWVQVDRQGAEEYVKGNIRHWADMGIRFLNVDFLSWFEDGYDKNYGTVGPGRPREHYETAMRWMFEAAEEHGILLKAVMPHLKNEAELERMYSHMFRINEDVAVGGWYRFSEDDRGNRREWWSQWANPMDGYAWWSQFTGRRQVTLCGDFIRLNTFDNDMQRRSVISQHLIAGGPVGVTDQHHSIGDHLRFYQNEELLKLNYNGFAGHPLSHDPSDPDSQIWTGRLSYVFQDDEGDHITKSVRSTAGINSDSADDAKSSRGAAGNFTDSSDDAKSSRGAAGNFTDSADDAKSSRGAAGNFTDSADGDWVVALFNREHSTQIRSIDFSVDLENFPDAKNGAVRDLWSHHDLGVFSSFSAKVPPHGVRVIRIRATGDPMEDLRPQYPHLWITGDAVPSGWDIKNPDEMIQDDQEPSIFTYKAYLSEGEFKIATFIGDWCDPYDWIRPPSMHPPLSDTGYIVTTGCPDEHEDYKWRITEPGYYKIRLDLDRETIEIAVATAASQPELEDFKGDGHQPKFIGLEQNYPNPFNPVTVIPYRLTVESSVRLEIYDILGRRVETLINGRKPAGRHEVIFDASSLPGGVYMYLLRTDALETSRKMLLLK